VFYTEVITKSFLIFKKGGKWSNSSRDLVVMIQILNKMALEPLGKSTYNIFSSRTQFLVKNYS
jgi:hypothetical protein